MSAVPAEEMSAIINQFMEDQFPDAVKFFEFTPVCGEEPYVSVQFSGILRSRTKIECHFSGWTKERIISETLLRVRDVVSSIMKIIDAKVLKGICGCQGCMAHLAKYRRFSAAAVYACNIKCNEDKLRLNLAMASVLEKSLERQEYVVDALRILPLPISLEIMWQFVA